MNQEGISMNHYTHLTIEEREEILKYSFLGFSICKIAKILHRNKSTISRELKRNASQGKYSPSMAQSEYSKRRTHCGRKKILNDPVHYEWVRNCFLDHQWSPEEIAGRLEYEKADWSISHNTIYRAIYAGLFDEKNLSHGNRGAIRKLRHRGKSRHTKDYVEKRGKIQISNELKDRPEEANNRSRLGDWEGDTVAGATGKACLVTYVDRKSRFLKCMKIAKKKSALVKEATIQLLKEEPLCTITPDRGKEFTAHPDITEELNQVQFYFPLPRHPWDRGTNENTNGLLREYFPKGKDLTDIPEEYIQEKVDELNKRPRKCLGYKTPYEVYYSETLHLI